MQRIAKQLNLVETVFITGTSSEQADFRFLNLSTFTSFVSKLAIAFPCAMMV
jgi:predicted PhzF superfamily epimerase YddE/YHI9